MDVSILLNLPEEEVVDSPKDVDNHIIALYSPIDKQESNDKAVEIMP